MSEQPFLINSDLDDIEIDLDLNSCQYMIRHSYNISIDVDCGDGHAACEKTNDTSIGYEICKNAVRTFGPYDDLKKALSFADRLPVQFIAAKAAKAGLSPFVFTQTQYEHKYEQTPIGLASYSEIAYVPGDLSQLFRKDYCAIVEMIEIVPEGESTAIITVLRLLHVPEKIVNEEDLYKSFSERSGATKADDDDEKSRSVIQSDCDLIFHLDI